MNPGIQTNMYNISRSMIANGIELFGYVLIEKLAFMKVIGI